MIKSVVVNSTESKKYPVAKVYEYCGRQKVVLFTCPRNGFVLHSDFPEEYVGYMRTEWNEDTFKPFHGELKIIIE